MYHWTEDMIRFMTDASDYGTYHQTLAGLIRPYLRDAGHICDAGCGLGDLSLALAPYHERITAVDIKPQALRVLRTHCEERGIRGIRTLEGDIHQLKPKIPYDGMVFCFFGKSEDILEIAAKQCHGPAVVIKKNYSRHRFSVGEYPTGPDGFTRLLTILEEKNIPCQKQTASLEFGQPFRCFEDVRRFYECYSRDEDPAVLTDEFLRSRVVETGRTDFPLYMPHRRSLGIICFQADDIKK